MAFFTVYYGNNESAMFNAECSVGSLTSRISETLLCQCPRAYTRLELLPLSFVLDNFAPAGNARGASVAFSESPLITPVPKGASTFNGSIPLVGLAARPLESYVDTIVGTQLPAASSAATGSAAKSVQSGYVLLGCRHGDQIPLHHLLLQQQQQQNNNNNNIINAGLNTGSPQSSPWIHLSTPSPMPALGPVTSAQSSRENAKPVVSSATGTATTATGTMTPTLVPGMGNISQWPAARGAKLTIDPVTAAQRTALMQQAQAIALLNIAGLSPHSANSGQRATSPLASTHPAEPVTPVAALLCQRNGMSSGADSQESWRAAFGQYLSTVLEIPSATVKDANSNGTNTSPPTGPGTQPASGERAESPPASNLAETLEQEAKRAHLLPPAATGLFSPPHPPITGYDVLWRGPRGEHIRLQEVMEEKLIFDVEPKKRRGRKA